MFEKKGIKLLLLFNPKYWKVFDKMFDQLAFEIFGKAPYVPIIELSRISRVGKFGVDSILLLFNGKLYLIPNNAVKLQEVHPSMGEKLQKQCIKGQKQVIEWVNNYLFEKSPPDVGFTVYKPILLNPLKQYQFKGKLFTWFVIQVLKWRTRKYKDKRVEGVLYKNAVIAPSLQQLLNHNSKL